jgi:hypothetical protein
MITGNEKTFKRHPSLNQSAMISSQRVMEKGDGSGALLLYSCASKLAKRVRLPSRNGRLMDHDLNVKLFRVSSLPSRAEYPQHRGFVRDLFDVCAWCEAMDRWRLTPSTLHYGQPLCLPQKGHANLWGSGRSGRRTSRRQF